MRRTRMVALLALASLSACADASSCYRWYAPCSVACPDGSSHQPSVSTCAPSFQSGGPPVGPATFCLDESRDLGLCVSSSGLGEAVCSCTPWVSTTTECDCPP